MNKYYTPSIEEFCVGFEYEVCTKSIGMIETGPTLEDETKVVVPFEKVWTPQTFSFKHINSFSCTYDLKGTLEDDRIRVKHLDKEDIESLGWTFHMHSIDDWFLWEAKCDDKGNYSRKINMGTWTSYKAVMHYGYKDQRMYINVYDTGVEGPDVFQGIIKNKSELKKLMAQIGISSNRQQ